MITGALPAWQVLPRGRRAASGGVRTSWGIALLATIAVIWGYGYRFDFELAVTALAFIGMVLTVAGLVEPALGILGVSVICTLDPVMRAYVLTGGLLRWNSFNYVLLLAMVLFWRRMLRWTDLPVRWLALFVVVLLLGLTISSDPFQGVQHVLGPVSYFGLLLYCERAGTSARTWAWAALIGGVTGAIGGLVFFLQDQSVQEFINPNAWAYFPLTALTLQCLALSREGTSERLRTVFLMLGALNAGWIFLSGSRGTSLTALVCLIFCGIRSRRLWSLAGVAVLVIVAASVLEGAFEQREERSVQRLAKLFDPGYSLAGRTSGRSDLARAGFHLFLDHPLTGIGTGSFSSSWFRLGDIRGLSKYGWGKEAQAHSGWVKTLAEAGLPGIVLFIGFVTSFAFVGARGRDPGYALLGLLVTSVLSVAFLATEFQNKGLWLLAAAATVFLRRPAGRLRSGEGMERRPGAVSGDA